MPFVDRASRAAWPWPRCSQARRQRLPRRPVRSARRCRSPWRRPPPTSSSSWCSRVGRRQSRTSPRTQSTSSHAGADLHRVESPVLLRGDAVARGILHQSGPGTDHRRRQYPGLAGRGSDFGCRPSLLTAWTPINGNAVGWLGSAGGTRALWEWPGTAASSFSAARVTAPTSSTFASTSWAIPRRPVLTPASSTFAR